MVAVAFVSPNLHLKKRKCCQISLLSYLVGASVVVFETLLVVWRQPIRKLSLQLLTEVPLFTLGEGPIFQLKIGSTSRRWVLDFNYKFLLLETALTSSSCDSINFWVELYIHRRNNMALDIFVVIFGGRFGGRFWNCRTGMETIHGLRAGHNPHQESTRGIEDAPGNWKRFCSTSRWLWRCARDPFGRDRIRQKISFLVILSLVVRSMHMLATAQLLALENGSIVSFIIEDTWFILFASLCVSPAVTF